MEWKWKNKHISSLKLAVIFLLSIGYSLEEEVIVLVVDIQGGPKK